MKTQTKLAFYAKEQMNNIWRFFELDNINIVYRSVHNNIITIILYDMFSLLSQCSLKVKYLYKVFFFPFYYRVFVIIYYIM